jgi:uncharacterized protein YacL
LGYLRLIYVGAVALVAAYFASTSANAFVEHFDLPRGSLPLTAVTLGLLGFIFGAGVGVALIRIPALLKGGLKKQTPGDRVTYFVGVFLGILGSSPLIVLFQSFGAILLPAAILIVLVSSSLIAIYALRSMRDVLPWYRDQRPRQRTGIKILDTNVIIDGRIYDVAQTGFLEGQLYVPKFVLEELQYIADSPDGLRRQRGKRGLDVLRLLQDKYRLEVGTKDHLIGDVKEEVDSRLVRLAQQMGADLVTNDMNLNHVANLQKVHVLNLNDLAMALKPNILPKETIELPIVKEGSQYNQGIGYLDDGTMVVVEGGKRHIGETVDVSVTQVIQTERGKMIFAEMPSEAEGEDRRPRRTTK